MDLWSGTVRGYFREFYYKNLTETVEVGSQHGKKKKPNNNNFKHYFNIVLFIENTYKYLNTFFFKLLVVHLLTQS